MVDEDENPFLAVARFNWMVLDDTGTRAAGSILVGTNANDVVCISWSVAIHFSTALNFNGGIVLLQLFGN